MVFELSFEINEKKTRNKKTDFLDITGGVPQGWILGPLLFIIFVSQVNCSL